MESEKPEVPEASSTPAVKYESTENSLVSSKLGLNVVCASFFLAVIADAYFQITTTHSWTPRDWEITIWTSGLALRGIYTATNSKK